MRWIRWEIVLHDLRYAARMLRKSWRFAATALLTLAVGIGASTAIFTAVDSVVLRPLTYSESDRLVAAWERVLTMSADPEGPNPRHADIWRKQATAFRGLALLQHSSGGLTLGTDHPRLVGTITCTPNLFDVLEVAPLLGRGFVSDDGSKGHAQVILLTHALWLSLFDGDPHVIGKTVRLADVPRQVIGVLPASFHFPNSNGLHEFRTQQSSSSAPEPAVFVPEVIDPNEYSWNGDYGNWVALARLQPGVSIQQAEAQLNTIEARIEREMPAKQRSGRQGALEAYVQPLQEAVVGHSRNGLWFLMAAVTGLMLIACMNLANAQLGRGLSRRRESAVRTALGAGSWRLVSNTLAES
jgi:predicted permease